VIGIDTGGGVWHRSQTRRRRQYLDRLGPTARQDDGWTWPAQTNTDGRIHLVGVDNLGNIWQSTETSANSASLHRAGPRSTDSYAHKCRPSDRRRDPTPQIQKGPNRCLSG